MYIPFFRPILLWVSTIVQLSSGILIIFQPILQQATGVLGEGSKSVIESGDQFEASDLFVLIFIIVNDVLQVFDNPNASDPTHSVLSKVRQATLHCTPD